MSYEMILKPSNDAQEAFLNLPEEDRNFLRDYKHHVEANNEQIIRILYGPFHPLRKKLYDWVNSNNENKKWYLKNINKIGIFGDGIEILGDIYDLEDIDSPKLISCLDEKKWHRKDAEYHAKLVGKEIPDWFKVIKFLPEKTRPNFFTDVMGMDGLYLSSSSTGVIASKNTINFGSALGTSGRLRLMTEKKNN